jgi:hypothetical protein
VAGVAAEGFNDFYSGHNRTMRYRIIMQQKRFNSVRCIWSEEPRRSISITFQVESAAYPDFRAMFQEAQLLFQPSWVT